VTSQKYCATVSPFFDASVKLHKKQSRDANLLCLQKSQNIIAFAGCVAIKVHQVSEYQVPGVAIGQ
jgi:hypothetical protein